MLGACQGGSVLENLIYLCYQPSGMFEALLGQIDPAAFPVWIPLTFGLAVGLAYAIVSSIRRSR